MIRKIMNRVLFLLSKRRYLKFIGLQYGTACRFISLTRETFGSEAYTIVLGDHVTVTAGVRFVTHDGGVWVLRNTFSEMDLIDGIHVGNNVFIGTNAVLLPGTVIEDNCVIGAGAVVKGRLASNGIYAGVPARRIKDLSSYARHVGMHAIPTKGLEYNKKKQVVLARMAQWGKG